MKYFAVLRNIQIQYHFVHTELELYLLWVYYSNIVNLWNIVYLEGKRRGDKHGESQQAIPERTIQGHTGQNDRQGVQDACISVVLSADKLYNLLDIKII
jgi:hypothetical protein